MSACSENRTKREWADHRVKNTLRDSPWWTPPVSLTVTTIIAHEFPATMLVVSLLTVLAIAAIISILMFVLRR